MLCPFPEGEGGSQETILRRLTLCVECERISLVDYVAYLPPGSSLRRKKSVPVLVLRTAPLAGLKSVVPEK